MFLAVPTANRTIRPELTMKQILSVLLILLCIHSSAQVKKTDRTTNNLLGPVKSTHLVYIRGEEKFGELVKSHTEFTLTEEYNKAGLLTTTKLVDGSSVTKTTYKYDKNGNLIEKREDEDGEVITIRLKYDNDGREIELDTYNDKDKLETRLKTKYNSDGNPEMASLYYSSGNLKEETRFIYNEKKQLSEKTSIDADNKMTSASMLEYDEKGRLSIILEMEENGDEDPIIRTSGYTYNDKGQVSIKDYFLADDTIKKDTFSYDEFGNVVMHFTDNNNFESDVLTYDNRNNWIKKIRTFNLNGNERKFILERDVKYY